jgi:hypothetical protein
LVAQQPRGALLATLNYDLLLDGELTRAGLDVNYLFASSYPDGCPLLKLHGSCNWLIDMPGMNRFVILSSDIRIEAEIRSVNSESEVIDYLTADTPLHPVMCLYTAEKPAPLCPSFFEHLRQQWAESVLEARQIGIIGVRPYPADAHIWQPLADTAAHLWCVGDRPAFDEWHQNSGRTSPTTVVADRFDTGLDPLWSAVFG